MSASARRLTAARVTTVLASFALVALSAGPARADRPITFFNGGVAGEGEARTDQDRQQLLASVSAGNAGPSPAGGDGVVEPVPSCVWQPSTAVTGTIGQVVPENGQVHEADRVEPDGSTSRLYARICEDGTVTSWQWFALADVPSVRASAVDDVRRRLPLPEPVLSPDLARGLVVNVATWFAAPAGQWTAVTGSAEALGLSVTVTATPVELVFDPGDGAAPVTCAGPGPT
ncbi:hypothetical protein I6A84_27485, partial [Frankia sp. CNm7]|nr:hypothetical protein [Frankia nepalensis]